MPGQDANPLPSDEKRHGKARTGEQMKGGNAVVSGETWTPAPRLSAGHLSLDFVNTIHPSDFLMSSADLIRWSQDVGLVTEERAQALLVEIEGSPEEGVAVFTQTIALREASYRVLFALIHQNPPDTSDLQVLQSLFIQARSHECLVSTDHHLTWQWEPAERGLTQLYWSLARSVEIMLTEPLIERVKECPPAKGGCGWLFADRSKNSSRQWCSDGECGSRVRMRRLYARKRANQER